MRLSPHSYRRTPFVLILFLMSLLASCAIPVETGVAVTPEQQQRFIRGQTTKAETLIMLGDPHQRVDIGGGKEQFLYIHNVINNLGGGLISAAEFWVTFENDVITDFGERPTTKRVPVGRAFQ